MVAHEALRAPWRSRIVGEEDEDPTQLLASPLNARIHPHTQEQALIGMLDQVGWVQRVIVSKRTGHVLDGHLRVAAAISRGEPTVPVLYVDVDAAEEKLILATMDPIAGMAGYDAEVLDQLLQHAQTDSAPLQALLDSMAAQYPAVPAGGVLQGDPDAVPDPPAEPISTRGDLWQLGRHRLLCGDATVRADVERLMNDRQADMVWTDPPYGVDHAGGSTDPRSPGFRSGDTIEGDGLDSERLGAMWRDALTHAWAACRPGAAWYVAASPMPHQHYMAASVLRALNVWRHTLIWDKGHWVFGRGDYHYQFEHVFYGWRGDGAHRSVTDRTQGNVWTIERPRRSDEHPTMKPVELVARALRNSSEPGQIVLDPFLGSGTAIVAAEQEGRTCYGLEIDPAYCDVICQRFTQLTGIQPVRP